MSSYLSNLLTQTTSRYNSLRRTLLSSEDDGDTEDDTHICRVLRAYYTEKGRTFPQWLPPDPNDRRAITPQPYAQATGYFTSAGGRSSSGPAQMPNAGRQRGSLNDLWDPPASAQASQPIQPQSLRNARRPPNPTAQSSNFGLAPPQARPLPSQRAGSYQSAAPQTSGRPTDRLSSNPSTASVSGGTAQDRLKARLWGAGRTSPAPQGDQGGGGASYDQNAGGANAPWNSSGGNPYDNGGGGSARRYGR